MLNNNQYKAPAIEKTLNSIIRFVFYWRLVIVLLSLSVIIYFCVQVYNISINDDKLKNAALILTGGSIIIGIFYSIINYEHNKLKFNHDVKTAKEILTFNTACKMHDAEMIGHFKRIRTFYETHKNHFAENKLKEIDGLLINETDSRVSFVVIFNYFESISLGIEQGIMDEDFMKSFFKTIFMQNFKRFGPYIEFMKKAYDSERIFWKYTALAQKWQSNN